MPSIQVLPLALPWHVWLSSLVTQFCNFPTMPAALRSGRLPRPSLTYWVSAQRSAACAAGRELAAAKLSVVFDVARQEREAERGVERRLGRSLGCGSTLRINGSGGSRSAPGQDFLCGPAPAGLGGKRCRVHSKEHKVLARAPGRTAAPGWHDVSRLRPYEDHERT
jgi:hypothetical protein